MRFRNNMRFRRGKGKRRSDSPNYALPTIFTVGTLFCGYFCLMKTVQALSLPPSAVDEAARLYNHAALAIGIAVLTDGLDGRIARMTNATSDFGREIDSLADVITFGVAPAVLAFAWGIRAADRGPGVPFGDMLPLLGYLATFLYVTCGAARLARFNVQLNPMPSNPGPPGKRYFVGLPIPPAAGMLAAVIHACSGYPIGAWWPWGLLWIGLIAMLAALMVSTWRYASFKDLGFIKMPSLMLIFFGTMIFLIWNFSQPVLLTLASVFVLSGIVTRITSLLKRPSADAEEESKQQEPSEQHN